MRSIICIGLLLLSLSLSGQKWERLAEPQGSRIWFRYPAQYWNSQALHLGNGYFGASFFGGVEEEVFALSEASMWTGGPAMGVWEKAGVNPRAKASIPLIREAVFSGDARRADSLIEADLFGSSELYGHFTSVGDLKIRFYRQSGIPEDYMRELDLQEGVGRVSYRMDSVHYLREYFCSYPDRLLVMRFSADRPERISMDISVDILQDSFVIRTEGKRLEVVGLINGNGRPFHVVCEVNVSGGSLVPAEGLMRVRNAGAVEIRLAMATNYRMQYPDYKGEKPVVITSRIIGEASIRDYSGLKARHVKDYQSLYNRVDLHIEGDPDAESLPTNERFRRICAGEHDPGYLVLAFNLGRYLIISSSRPGTLPANLQGVWNTFRVAPWAGNYQSNINLQEIYWSCGPTALSECQEPYIDWIEDLSKSGREVARQVYGTGGWVSHTTGNIWGHAAPIGDHPWGMYPMGAAWHCQHIWDQFQFNGDTLYLESRAYPLLKGASRFWLENLVPFDGYLATAPSVSAEHGALQTNQGLDPAYHDLRSDCYRYSLPGIYQDIQMIHELFTMTAGAAGILGDTAFERELLSARERLLPLKVGRLGQIQEWWQDIDSPGCHHRHIAHLYAVCPGTMIHPVITPELADAARVSLDMRGDGRFPQQELASGGNWARAHRMWCRARLMEGDRALETMKAMLTEQGFENVLTYQHASYHWERRDLWMDRDLYAHFQLDGSAAIPGCIAEMLLQSHLGEIHLLPALPGELPTGMITGLKARGGFTVDLEWNEGELIRARIHCPPGKARPTVRLVDSVVNPDQERRIEIIH